MKPILFSTEMVQALIEGRKSMTRRVITKNNSSCTAPFEELDFTDVVHDGIGSEVEYLKVAHPEDDTRHRVFPKWWAEDSLWVKETFQIKGWDVEEMVVAGRYLDEKPFEVQLSEKEWNKFSMWQNKTGVKSSLFMFKSLSRIFLEIEDIKIERVQDISELDSQKEGVKMYPLDDTHKQAFERLWGNINGVDSWKLNPFVWVIEFRKL